MTVIRDEEIARYVDEVRRALADLPPSVRDELLEDLPEHLTEVAAEADGSLVDRLGTPQAYAAELRAASGVGAPRAAPNLDQRITATVVRVRGRLRTIDTKVGPVIGYAQASEFLRLLRPAWWVLRGYLAAILLSALLSDPPHGLLPRIDHSELAGLVVLVVSVVASIWLGRRSSGLSRWPRLAVNASAVLIAIFGLVILLNVDNQARWNSYYEPVYNDPYSHIQDVYVYDGQGQLVEGARLFDQNGEPIRIGHPWCPEAELRSRSEEYVWSPEEGPMPYPPLRQTYPYCPQAAPFRLPGPPSTTPSVATPSPGGEPTPTPVASPEPPTPRASTPGEPASPTPGG